MDKTLLVPTLVRKSFTRVRLSELKLSSVNRVKGWGTNVAALKAKARSEFSSVRRVGGKLFGLSTTEKEILVVAAGAPPRFGCEYAVTVRVCVPIDKSAGLKLPFVSPANE